jgi:hypothetical protein
MLPNPCPINTYVSRDARILSGRRVFGLQVSRFMDAQICAVTIAPGTDAEAEIRARGVGDQAVVGTALAAAALRSTCL